MPLQIAHPLLMLAILAITAVNFSLLGLILGTWSDSFEQLRVIPLLIISPLAYLSGSFYSIDVLPSFWRTVTLFNPLTYLMSALRWSLYDTADVDLSISLLVSGALLVSLLLVVRWIFKTGHWLKN